MMTRKHSARIAVSMCLAIYALCLAASCGVDEDEYGLGPPDAETMREIAACGQTPSEAAPVPPGTYIDQKITIDYNDPAHLEHIVENPKRLEQVYADASRGHVVARWLACNYEAGSRGAARSSAKKLAGLRCQTIASCQFRFEKLPFSDSTASGMRVLTRIADAFEKRAKEAQLTQEILGHALTLFVGTRVLRARMVPPPKVTLPKPAPVAGKSARGPPTMRTLTPAELAQVRGAGPVQRFSSFRAFKRTMGKAGEGRHWHHIVEQHPGNVARFGATEIHTTTNIINVDAAVHRKVSGHYSSVVDGSKPLTVRKWLSTQSFETQRAYGIEALRKVGGIP